MRSVIIAAACLAIATSAEAETWTCSPSGTPTSVLYRFTLSPPDVISTYWPEMRFRIVQNDDYQLVATGLDAMTEEMVSAGVQRLNVFTIAINKVTGAFGLSIFKTSENESEGADTLAHGKCLKD